MDCLTWRQAFLLRVLNQNTWSCNYHRKSNNTLWALWMCVCVSVFVLLSLCRTVFSMGTAVWCGFVCVCVASPMRLYLLNCSELQIISLKSVYVFMIVLLCVRFEYCYCTFHIDSLCACVLHIDSHTFCPWYLDVLVYLFAYTRRRHWEEKKKSQVLYMDKREKNNV